MWQAIGHALSCAVDILTSSQSNWYLKVPPGEVELPASRTLTVGWIGNAGWTN